MAANRHQRKWLAKQIPLTVMPPLNENGQLAAPASDGDAADVASDVASDRTGQTLATADSGSNCGSAAAVAWSEAGAAGIFGTANHPTLAGVAGGKNGGTEHQS